MNKTMNKTITATLLFGCIASTGAMATELASETYRIKMLPTPISLLPPSTEPEASCTFSNNGNKYTFTYDDAPYPDANPANKHIWRGNIDESADPLTTNIQFESVGRVTVVVSSNGEIYEFERDNLVAVVDKPSDMFAEGWSFIARKYDTPSVAERLAYGGVPPLLVAEELLPRYSVDSFDNIATFEITENGQYGVQLDLPYLKMPDSVYFDSTKEYYMLLVVTCHTSPTS